MKVSVIIPTLNRERDLVRTIKDILKDTYPDFELIVVDQTEEHTAETKQELKNLAPRITVVNEAVKSLPHARNIGIERARGAIILFLDDDIIPEPGLIAAHVKNYENVKIAGVGGRVVMAGEEQKSYPQKLVTEPAATVFHKALPQGGVRSASRAKTYQTFFRNNTYFFLLHMHKIYLPIFLLSQWKQFLGCVLRYSARAPFRGVTEAFSDYRRGPKLYENFIR